MRNARKWQGLWLAGLLGCGGAQEAEEAIPEAAPVESVTSAATHQNGTNLNGTNLNGTNLNGTNLNGTNLNGTNLNGTNLNGGTLGGLEIEGLHLNGTLLAGEVDGELQSGTDFVGAELFGQAGDGLIKLRIESMVKGTGSNSDVWFYDVSYEAGPDDWRALCRDAQGARTTAVPVSGTWSYEEGVPGGGAHTDSAEAFTFGCRGAGISKCVEMGYKPWKTVGGVALGNHHQACTRMIRGDYCGDGTPYTQDGNWVNVFDALGVQHDTRLLWLFESEWGVNGARCFSLLNRAHEWVPCYLQKATQDCGLLPHFNSQTLLMTEIPLL